MLLRAIMNTNLIKDQFHILAAIEIFSNLF